MTLHPTCNGCGRIAPESEGNEMGYCRECLADSSARTYRAYRTAYRPRHNAQAEAEAIAKGPSTETVAACAAYKAALNANHALDAENVAP